MKIRSGNQEQVPYSISRDTDVLAFYMDWFTQCMNKGEVLARTSHEVIPSLWSLKPEDIYYFVFWSRDYSSLIKNWDIFKDIPFIANITVNGYESLSKKSPNWELAL